MIIYNSTDNSLSNHAIKKFIRKVSLLVDLVTYACVRFASLTHVQVPHPKLATFHTAQQLCPERLFPGFLFSVYLFLVHKLIFEFFPTQKIKSYSIQVILMYIF